MTNPPLSSICDSIESILRDKLFHPRLTGSALNDLITTVMTDCRGAAPGDAVEGINRALAGLDVSNTVFWGPEGRPLSSQGALTATLQMFLDGTEEAWIFTNVLPGGIAAQSGIKQGDQLLTVNNAPVTASPVFGLGRTYILNLRAGDGSPKSVTVNLPASGPANRPPMIEPEALSSSIVKPKVGLLRVSAFPAIVGFDFARQLNGIVEHFRREQCSRLIVDLRGNSGGGIGSLRLMSILTPQRLDVGYSLSRAERNNDPSSLPVINRIPHTKLGLYLMAIRFKVFQRRRSLRLVTEGFGKLPFQGKVAIMVDGSTRSGAEMVAAFAQRNSLAKVIGTKTPGETLGCANFRVQEAYRLRIPLVGWFLPQGEMLERKGVTPDQLSSPTLPGLRAGKDEVLDAALAAVA